MTQRPTTAASALAGALHAVLAPGSVVAAADLPRVAGDNPPDLTIVAINVVSLDGAYAVPPAPPAATIDLLSPASLTLRGELLLDQKRELLAAQGVPLHLEINIYGGVLTLWIPDAGTMVSAGSGQSFTCEALGNAIVEVPGAGVLRVYNPDRVLIAEFDARVAKAAKVAGRTYDTTVAPTEPVAGASGSLDMTELNLLH
jgi:hypothetical protein